MYSSSDFYGLRLHDVYLSRHANLHSMTAMSMLADNSKRYYSKDTMSLGPGRLEGLQASHASSCNVGVHIYVSILALLDQHIYIYI